MNLPKVSVVVPTRERADTLAFTLQSCVAQSYDNLEIIVCDNDSKDHTRSVVKSVDDGRIKYVCSGRRLSMSDNWTYALSHATGDYLTVVGDDDALLPNAVSDLIGLMSEAKTEVVTWKKIEYCWPNHINPRWRNFLSIPLINSLTRVSGKVALNHIYAFRMGYSRGPCIYNSLVSSSLLRRIESRDGVLFGASSPDVYSTLALASIVGHYLYSTRPFSINGASAHSNGASAMMGNPEHDNSPNQLFLSEVGTDKTGFVNITGSINAAVADSLVAFSSIANVDTPKIPFRRLFSRICGDFMARPELMARGESVLRAQAIKYGQLGQVDRLRRCHESLSRIARTEWFPANNYSVDDLVLWGDRLGISDVKAASDFSFSLLGLYDTPKRINDYSFYKKIFSRLLPKAYGTSFYVGL